MLPGEAQEHPTLPKVLLDPAACPPLLEARPCPSVCLATGGRRCSKPLGTGTRDLHRGAQSQHRAGTHPGSVKSSCFSPPTEASVYRDIFGEVCLKVGQSAWVGAGR